MLYGKQYAFLQPGEPSATARLKHERYAEQQNCDLQVFKQTGDVQVVEPVKKIRIDTRFACLRFNEMMP